MPLSRSATAKLVAAARDLAARYLADTSPTFDQANALAKKVLELELAYKMEAAHARVAARPAAPSTKPTPRAQKPPAKRRASRS